MSIVGTRLSLKNVRPNEGTRNTIQRLSRRSIVNRQSSIQSLIANPIANHQSNRQLTIDNAIVNLQSAIGSCLREE